MKNIVCSEIRILFQPNTTRKSLYSYNNINYCPNKTTDFTVQSVLSEDQTQAGRVAIRLTESKSAACAEYKCPESDDHGIRVNVIPLTAGYFTKYHEATQDFINEMSSTLSEAFSFKPEFIDDPRYKKEKEQECMRKRTKAGIRFKCPTM